MPKPSTSAGRASKKERDKGRKDKDDAANHTFIEKSFGCSLQTQAQCEGCMVKSDRAARCPSLSYLLIRFLANRITPGCLHPAVTPAE